MLTLSGLEEGSRVPTEDAKIELTSCSSLDTSFRSPSSSDIIFFLEDEVYEPSAEMLPMTLHPLFSLPWLLLKSLNTKMLKLRDVSRCASCFLRLDSLSVCPSRPFLSKCCWVSLPENWLVCTAFLCVVSISGSSLLRIFLLDTKINKSIKACKVQWMEMLKYSSCWKRSVKWICVDAIA